MAPHNTSLVAYPDPPARGPNSSQTTSQLPTIIVIVILSISLTVICAFVAVALVRSRYRSRYGLWEDRVIEDESRPNSPATESKRRPFILSSSLDPLNKTFVINLPLFSASPIKVYHRSPSLFAKWMRRFLSPRCGEDHVESGPTAEEDDVHDSEKIGVPDVLDTIVIPHIQISDESDIYTVSTGESAESQPDGKDTEDNVFANGTSEKPVVNRSLLSPSWRPRDAPVSVAVNVSWTPDQVIDAEVSPDMTLEFLEAILEEITDRQVKLLAVSFNGDRWTPQSLNSSEDLQAMVVQPLRMGFQVEIDAYAMNTD